MYAAYYILFITCGTVVLAAGNYNCEYPSIYDTSDDYFYQDELPYIPNKTTPKKMEPGTTTQRLQTSKFPETTSTAFPSTRTTFRPTPPRLNAVATDRPLSSTILSRVGEDMNNLQQTQINELNCLKVLDNLMTRQWQEEIDRISVQDLGNINTTIQIPVFESYYSNPQSEWIQIEGMALKKLDKCVRNVVSKIAPRMDREEIECLNKMYPDYLTRESKTGKIMDMKINESYREQLPFKSMYTYFEMTEVLFDNKNIDALDGEARAVHEDMLEFYIKTEEDKTKKFFIIEQECEWKNARILREASSENERYKKFGELVRSLTNRYLVSEILHKWIPGFMIPDVRYNLWSKARDTMNQEILDKMNELQIQKRDAQFLCTYAAQLATKFYEDQKTILFDQMKNTSLSSELKVIERYSYIIALKELMTARNDERLPRVEILANEFKEESYCLINFVRMIENHQRYMIASAFVNEVLPYGITYCQVKEMSAELVNPRYCKCQGTYCEEFGLATLRAQRFQLNLLPDGTYSVTTNSSYRILPLDELINSANQRIAEQKFNTWWYRHQKEACLNNPITKC